MRYARSLAVTKRLADLLALIQAGDYSSSTLAEKLDVSEQTVYRDILCLKQQGHCIRAVKHSSYWAYEIAESASARPAKGRLHP
ncbi:MAG: helix-turn-helix domain-containing protein [Tepidisphaeraceae bacterium]|jgi:DeoR/GlpR family transcriptional regulator of sugar metabolism